MRIIFLITGLGVGGAERQVSDLADQLTFLGHNVLIISLTGEVITRPQNKSIKIINLSMNKNPFSFITTYIKCQKIIKSFRPDILHSHMVHANIFSRLLRITTPIHKLICTAHSSNEGGRLRLLAYRLTDHLADLSTNVSEEARQAFIRGKAMSIGRSKTVHNGIDINRFAFDPAARSALRAEIGVDEKTTLFMSVGRLTDAKDYHNLLRAISYISPTSWNFKSIIIGTGDQKNQLKILTNSLKITEQVDFIGSRNDVERWLSAADIFVMSSKWEGLPLAVLEAMACERVVVATDCGGIKNAVGKAGLIVPSQNSKELAKALEHALQMSTSEREQLGQAGRRRVSELYSLEAVAEHWIKIYQGSTC